ncbi:MAG: hypothetical protein H7Z20_06220 [Bdellovibrio sp.]|nr:hypothetical protein [Methylotenera sp.]
MKVIYKLAFGLLFSTLVFLPLAAQASCGGAFCSLNSDWDIQGVASKPGVRLDIRAEFIDQDQLRSGAHKAAPAGEVDEHDEVRTINRNLLATLDWNINADWGITFKVPLVSRAHNHIFNKDDGFGGVDPETENWNFSGIGDVQALARYRFYNDTHANAGVRFGLKLPTGSIHKRNTEEAAERTLQPGSGSVDSLLGAYYNHHDGNVGWFAQGIWQQTISDRDNFKPGRKLSADVGLSYKVTPDFSVMLQINAQHKARDSGANAEPADSGGYTISVSPGASYRLTSSTSMYGFVQKPLVQQVNGAQLTPDWSLAIGIATAF